MLYKKNEKEVIISTQKVIVAEEPLLKAE